MNAGRSILLALGASLALGGSARAGEARCLWDAISPATQDRLLASFGRSGALGVSDVKLDPAEARRQLLRCGQLGGSVEPKRVVQAMDSALRGYVARNGAVQALTALGGPTEEHLEAAWRELGPRGREALRLAAEAGEGAGGAEPRETFLAIVDRVSALPRTDPAVQRGLDAYLAGRSQQEAFEPRF